MVLIDDIIPLSNLFSPPTTILEDSPSYTLEDDLELPSTLSFDNPGNTPRCLIHSIPMTYEFDLKSPWKCPVCEK